MLIAKPLQSGILKETNIMGLFLPGILACGINLVQVESGNTGLTHGPLQKPKCYPFNVASE